MFFFNTECPAHCPNCNQEGLCKQCKAGWYGSVCQNNCSNCGGNGVCSKSNGVCAENVCKLGYYSYFCNNTCPLLCADDGSCDFTSGRCFTCPDGTYGNFCGQKCPNECTQCSSISKCSECKAGRYGKTCHLECRKCGDDKTCNKTTGECINGCAAGWKDLKCNTRCPDICAGDGSCNDTTGECLHGWRSCDGGNFREESFSCLSKRWIPLFASARNTRI